MSDLEGWQAAWQKAPGQPLTIESVVRPQLADNEILVRNAAVAINPLDWLLQDAAILPWLDYPTVNGSDVAGEVVAVGSKIMRFRPGDRVLGQAVSTTINKPSQGAFQTYTAVFEHMASPIPDALSFVDASVLPLGLGTAACGLYQKEHLGLVHPSTAPLRTDETVLVWGAASSVGCSAIQLAVASGYECVAVASPHHTRMLKELGAIAVFDYRDPAVVDTVSQALQGKLLAGALHATGNLADCVAVISRSEGRRLVAMTLPTNEALPESVVATHINGTSLKDDEIGDMIYCGFLPEALANQSYCPAPLARVVGHGLDALQGALETLKAGVSGEKIVVTLAL